MKEQFCNYEISLKFKNLGFNENCFAEYTDNKLLLFLYPPECSFGYCPLEDFDSVDSFEGMRAPLWQQVIAWIKEIHHIDIIISSNTIGYGFILYHRYPPKNTLDDRVFQSYNEAQEAAILKAIEIIK